MPNSYKEYDTPGTGANGLGQTTFSVPFKFISINDINVKGFNGTTWTPLTISTRGTDSVTLDAAPSSYNAVRLYRATSSDQLVDFQAGARLSESDLDTAYQQGLYAAQEVIEDASLTQFNAVRNASIVSGTTLANFASQAFTATAGQTEFNITTFTPQTSSAEAYRVSIDGAMQSPTDAYTISMSPAKMTLTSAAPTGSKVVIVTAASAASATAVDDTTLEVVTSTNKIQVKDSGVTNAKLAGGITQDKLAGGITNAQLAGSITEDKLAGSIPTSKLTGIIDDDTMSTGVTSTSVSSSESIKAYVDNTVDTTAIGVGQKWQGVTRAFNTTYTNNTGRPISVIGNFHGDTDDHHTTIHYTYSDNSTASIPFSSSTNSGGSVGSLGFTIIPTGASYRFTKGGDAITSFSFYELR